jgi:hypothetical protein
MGRLRNKFSQPPIEAQKPKKGRRLAVQPLAARVESPPARATISSNWQRERVQRLTRIFRCIDGGLARGKRLNKMLVKHAWRWRARHYKANPAQAIHFRKSTLLRLYYTWRDGGRTPDTLALHYWRGNRKASLGQVIELSKLCLAPDTKSFSAAYRKLANPGATHWAFRVATPAPLRAAVAELLAHRRHEQVLEQAARRILAEVAK